VTLLSEQHSERAFLAAPTGSGAIAIMAAAGSAESDWPHVPASMQEELYLRFGVALAALGGPSEAQELETAGEPTLRRLAIAALVTKLQDRGWIAVEHPTRLCRAEVFASAARFGTAEAPAPKFLQLPSIDLLCKSVNASAEKQALAVELEIIPSVWSSQPLGPQLRLISGKNSPVDAYSVDASGKLLMRPPVSVLPALTAAEVSRVWPRGLPPGHELPRDLCSVSAFKDYWHMVHGYLLPEAALSGFARVTFPRAGLVLTYPLACLWLQPWAQRPMLSVKVGPQIIKTAMESLKHLWVFGQQLDVRAELGNIAVQDVTAFLHAQLPKDIVPTPTSSNLDGPAVRRATLPLHEEEPDQQPPAKRSRGQSIPPTQGIQSEAPSNVPALAGMPTAPANSISSSPISASSNTAWSAAGIPSNNNNTVNSTINATNITNTNINTNLHSNIYSNSNTAASAKAAAATTTTTPTTRTGVSSSMGIGMGLIRSRTEATRACEEITAPTEATDAQWKQAAEVAKRKGKRLLLAPPGVDQVPVRPPRPRPRLS